jgi:hypothetical protein
MDKNTKIYVALGSLGLIGIYLYLKKSQTSAVSVTNDSVLKSASVNSVKKTTTATTIFDKIFNVGTAVAKSTSNSNPTNTIKTSAGTGSGSYTPISIGVTPQTNPKQPSSTSELLSSPGISMKDTTLEDQNAGLGSLTTAGKDYTNIDNPTGYVDPNAYPDTIVILPQAEGEYTSIPNIEAPSTPDTLPTDIPSWAQQGPDPVLDSANIDNYDYYYSGFGDTQGGGNGGQQAHRGDDSDPYGYGGVPSS